MSCLLNAQDPIFKQFYASSVYTNPALTGIFKGSWRANINYRQQWTSTLDNNPFRTINAAFDMRIPVVSEDYMAFGLSTLYDNAGYGNLGKTNGTISLSYLKNLGELGYDGTHFLVLGAQAGMNQFRVDFNNFTFNSQYNSTFIEFDPNIQSGEFSPASNSLLNLNTGLMYYAVLKENKSFYIGGSIFNINSPQVSFFNIKSLKIPRRFSFNLGAELPFNDNFSTIPAGYLNLQGPSMSATYGLNFRYSNNDYDEMAIRFGVWNTMTNKAVGGINNDGLTFSTLFEWNQWNVGLSYDVHTSSITNINNGRGALELSVVYRQPEVKKVKVLCPNF
jgi:type IX secretion system PorP/SprF family membrane protein